MTLEEYVIKRKREAGINEINLKKRMENPLICVNYIFEYFNNYLDTRPADEKTALHEQKVDKYRKILSQYSPEVQDWLISLYSSYGKYIHKHLMNLLNDDYFLLYDSEAEFRALSYEVYPKAVKKFKFLESQSEMVFRFIKDAHRIRNSFHTYDDFYISDEINEWIYETYNRHGVNIYKFCEEWVHYFFSYPDLWPKGHKKKSKYYEERSKYSGVNLNDSLFWDYDYKQKSNLFGLDLIYRGMPKKSFVRGKKQELEATLMYGWLHGVERDEEYWCEYAQTVLGV